MKSALETCLTLEICVNDENLKEEGTHVCA